MILFSVGVQSRFAGWCDFVTARLVEHALGPVAMVGANTLEEVALAVIRTEVTHIVICSRQPNAGLRTALAETNGRLLVALEDPRIGVADTVAVHGVGLEPATRVVASSCAAISGHLSASGS